MTRPPYALARIFVTASLCAALAACAPPPATTESQAGPTSASALAFLADVEKQYDALSEEYARIGWVNETYINFDTDWLASNIGARATELGVKYAKQAATFDGIDVPADARRKLELLKLGLTLPAPETPGAAQELADITTRLGSTYSVGKIEFEGRTVPQSETEVLMRQLRDPAKLEEVWTKWHDYAKGMKADYARMVGIANEGARELGFADVGAMWRAGYDMPPDDVHRGGGPAVGPGEAALRRSALLRARQAQRTLRRRRRAARRADSRRLARQHVGAELGRRSTI